MTPITVPFAPAALDFSSPRTAATAIALVAGTLLALTATGLVLNGKDAPADAIVPVEVAENLPGIADENPLPPALSPETPAAEGSTSPLADILADINDAAAPVPPAAPAVPPAPPADAPADDGPDLIGDLLSEIGGDDLVPEEPAAIPGTVSPDTAEDPVALPDGDLAGLLDELNAIAGDTAAVADTAPSDPASEASTPAASQLDENLAALGLPTDLSGQTSIPAPAATPGLPVPSLPTLSDPAAGGSAWGSRFPFAANRPVAATDSGTPATAPAAPQSAPATAAPDAPATLTRSFVLNRTPSTPAADARPDIPPEQMEEAVQLYGRLVATLISQEVTYPERFAADQRQGDVLVGLIVNDKGELQRHVVINSSGDEEIDKEALRVVSGIRYPLPPKGAPAEKLRFGIRLGFTPPEQP